MLVMDHLNTHAIQPLYKTFLSARARALMQRLEIHPTPKRGNGLNLAEIELSVLRGQFLNRCLPDLETFRWAVAAWEVGGMRGTPTSTGTSPWTGPVPS